MKPEGETSTGYLASFTVREISQLAILAAQLLTLLGGFFGMGVWASRIDSRIAALDRRVGSLDENSWTDTEMRHWSQVLDLSNETLNVPPTDR